MKPWRESLFAAIPFLTVWILIFILMALGSAIEGRHPVPFLERPISHHAPSVPQDLQGVVPMPDRG